jgi:hypothetical protein
MNSSTIYIERSIYKANTIYRGIPPYTGNHPEKRGIPGHTPGKPPNIGRYSPKTPVY